MRTRAIFFTILAVFFLSGVNVSAQEVHWSGLQKEDPHLVSARFGADFVSYYGLSYGYVFEGSFPLVLGVEADLPFGAQVFDDWDSRLSIQARAWHNDRWSINVKPSLFAKGYQAELAKLLQVGAGVELAFGYERPRWGLRLETAYDHYTATHIVHKELEDQYPDIQDGWFGPTGGTFKFGIRGNYQFGRWNVFLKLGKAYGQDFRDNPSLPFYVKLSIQRAF